MKLFSSTFLIVVAALVMTAGLAAVAQADMMYVGWRSTPPGGVATGAYEYDVATGSLIPNPPFAPIAASGSMQGIAISPLDGYIYAINGGNKEIRRYNPDTGAAIDAGAWVTMGGTTRGLAFDSSGNLYAATGYRNYYGIAKIEPDKTVTDLWGDFGDNNYFAADLEVRGSTLYGACQQSLYTVASWDLATGGAAAAVVTGFICDGVAFGPDGTLYTTWNYESPGQGRYVQRWDIANNTATTILTVPHSGHYIGDVDYWGNDGYLYAFDSDDVWRCSDPTAATPTWTVHIAGPAGAGSAGYMAFRIPEPGTFALLGMGMFGLLAYAWRRRK